MYTQLLFLFHRFSVRFLAITTAKTTTLPSPQLAEKTGSSTFLLLLQIICFSTCPHLVGDRVLQSVRLLVHSFNFRLMICFVNKFSPVYFGGFTSEPYDSCSFVAYLKRYSSGLQLSTAVHTMNEIFFVEIKEGISKFSIARFLNNKLKLKLIPFRWIALIQSSLDPCSRSCT